MSKKYLGIICLLYAGIFIYVILFDKIKYFLAPQMQIYIKLSLTPIILIGLTLLLNNKINYKFKISDLVLLLPIILLILSGDGRLTASFAKERIINTNVSSEKNIEQTQEQTTIEESDNSYDFTNPYFDILDTNYNELANYITFSPKAEKYEGKTIKVKGLVLKNIEFINNDFSAIGKYIISCCAADAGFSGFIIKYDQDKIFQDKWYEIEGVLKKGKDKDGYDIMYIEVINIKEIDSNKEEQYIYPCYFYDDGKCESVLKYNLEH